MRQSNNRLKPITEGGILSAIAIVLSVAGAYLPMLSIVTDLLWPAPIALLGVRHGFRWSIMATVASGLILGLLLHPLQALFTIVGMGLLAVTLGHSFRYGYGPARTLACATVASLVSLACMIGIGGWLAGINPLNMQMEMFDEAVKQVMEFYAEMGMSGEMMAQLTTQMNQMLTLIKIVFPAIFLMAAAFSAWINYTIVRLVLTKMGHASTGLPAFDHWQAPRASVWALALAMGLIWFGNSNSLELTSMIGANIQILTSIALLINGLAVTVFYLGRYRMPKFFKVVICLFIAVNSFLAQIAVLAGIMDVIFDFRKLRPTEETK